MKKTLAGLLLVVGGLFAGAASMASPILIFDEPKMPKSMIK